MSKVTYKTIASLSEPGAGKTRLIAPHNLFVAHFEEERLMKNICIQKLDNLYRMAYAYLKNNDDALEAVERIVWQAMWRPKYQWGSSQNLLNLYRIAFTTIMKLYQNTLIQTQPLNQICEPDFPYRNGELYWAMSVLPHPYRFCAILHYFESLSYEEIAICMSFSSPGVIQLLLSVHQKIGARITYAEETGEKKITINQLRQHYYEEPVPSAELHARALASIAASHKWKLFFLHYGRGISYFISVLKEVCQMTLRSIGFIIITLIVIIILLKIRLLTLQ